MDEPIEVFYSYSHKDEELRDKLETHLALLKRQGIITGWHDRRITAGKEWAKQIDEHLDAAAIILLLVSAHFLASDYCYDVEMPLVAYHSLPIAIVAVVVFALLPRRDRDKGTRCRSCGYILHRLTEPRCPECGQAL